MPVENESLGSRWSRRKQLVAEEAAKDKKIASGEIAATSDEEMVVDPEVLREKKQAQLNALTDDDMPDIETLDEGSDYSGFMSTGVSESLRKIALRKLFHSETYNVRDGLDDYDGDYTFFEKLDPTTVTSDMKHMFEVEAKRALAKKEQEEEQEEEERLLAEAEDVDGSDEFDELADEIEADDLELANNLSVAEGSLIEKENLVEASKVINTNSSDNADNSNNEDVA